MGAGGVGASTADDGNGAGGFGASLSDMGDLTGSGDGPGRAGDDSADATTRADSLATATAAGRSKTSRGSGAAGTSLGFADPSDEDLAMDSDGAAMAASETSSDFVLADAEVGEDASDAGVVASLVETTRTNPEFRPTALRPAWSQAGPGPLTTTPPPKAAAIMTMTNNALRN